jgi:hypothetical protein
MELAFEDVKASLRRAGWEEVWGPPPVPHEFIVKREYLEKVVDVDKACLKSQRPVLYLAADAGGKWYVVGPVPPTPHNCLPVTFKKEFPDAASAVGELVEYAMKIFRFYPRWFKIGVVKEAGLCNWPEFYFLCHHEDVASLLNAKTQKKETPHTAGGQPDGDGTTAGSVSQHAASPAAPRQVSVATRPQNSTAETAAHQAAAPGNGAAEAESRVSGEVGDRVDALRRAVLSCLRRFASGGCLLPEGRLEEFLKCLEGYV